MGKRCAAVNENVDGVVAQLEAQEYSIHFHVWTPEAFLEVLRVCREQERMPFELAAFEQGAGEFVVVLRKC